MPHALLVSGAAGIGKRHLVEILTAALLCPTPRPDGLACGSCQDCHLLSVGSHPDRVLLGPDPDGTSKEIRVDSVRQLLDSEALTPARGRHKVVLIDPAHRLNRSAANSLLKTLEEPSPTTFMVLITEAPGSLPATIRSRCQALQMRLPREDEVLGWLAPQVGDEDPLLLLRLAHGAPLRALSLREGDVLAQRERRLEGLHGVFCGSRDPVAEAHAWLDIEPSLLCDWLACWIGDLLRLAVDPACRYMVNPDKRPLLTDLARGLDLASTHRYLRRVIQARAQVDSTINRQLLYESLLIQLARLGPEIS